MTDPNFLWLYGFVLLIGGSLLTKEKVKQVFVAALLCYATAFVCNGLYQASHSPLKQAKGGLGNANNAEVYLKFESAFTTLGRGAGSFAVGKSKDMVKDRRENLLAQAEQVLKKDALETPDDPMVLARVIIITHELGHPFKTYRERLASLNTEKSKELLQILDDLYVNAKSLDAENRKKLARNIETQFSGWYRSVALMHLYKVTRQTEQLSKVVGDFDGANMRFLARFIILLGFMGLAFLGGLIVILVNLFIMPRRITPPEHREQVASPGKYGALTIYSVMIAWQATVQAIGSVVQVVLKDAHFLQKGAVVAGAATFLLYLLTNGPGILWVYFLALKPRSIKFLEGIRLRFKVDRNGPFRLALYGFLTWMAAVPCVVVAYLIAAKYLGSQGSSNPIIPIVMQAARTNDIAATLIFYSTLGILAPICEEILFRGFLYTALRRYWGILPSMLVSAALFAGVHLDAGAFLPLMTLGMLFAFTLERTRSILPCIVAHGLWNSGTFTMVLLVFSP
ncbi:MAG: hypothetical protein C0507_09920 [Cyanobacteria bacterium PR.3.49]|nr:hypothetical protein [Cyanobacteria bacterium PR.3.49]